MKQSKSASQAQRFLFTPDQINTPLHRRRDHVDAGEYRSTGRAFAMWADINEVAAAA